MRSIDRPGVASGQSGQAAVETALIAPMMVFMVLGIIQLGMVHNARLMTEYGAYRAVRAGIVNHGDCKLMEKAALASLLPTLPPLDGKEGRVDTVKYAVGVHKAYSRKLLATSVMKMFYTDVGLPLFRVDVVNPKKGELDELFGTYGSHLDAREIDYDDVRDDRVIEANLLSVRLTYFYELRIPFANWQLHSFYLGRDYLDQLKGFQFESQRVGGRNATQYLQDRGRNLSPDHGKIVSLARLGGNKSKYVMPLVATWSMRMQSNYLNNDQHGPGRCAVDG
ncbi:pilus assembly protein [Myxococcus sp. CA051A]|uniref:TadE/TadG family type IV pilus assembly protein n=1 Tax=unclassified Myxococcus TaxID=2648731 RepID=UPI00157A743F|nr:MULTISPECIES: TadE family protein [unclassified Myxococcus]NTX06391.1 pilus assembly protein [Myxococcus sp. CA040A]NTX09646.1 pilus assembly protein [Myxococcus sp. CA056]NTX35010.1 pilus assembly protein [Myxococcus sp. CA033]NTX51477.1 pilus assembly protein [Myxococcus sp. CA039A]NTX64984.1 pilus assembly protein [Myxococcus sp. CA051A]